MGKSGGGQTIANLIPRARSANTWRTSETLWRKWAEFCAIDGISVTAGNEASILRYLGWLFDTNSVSGTSVRNYLSAVTTTLERTGQSVRLTNLIQLAINAYQQADMDRKLLADPSLAKERTPLPASIAGRILTAALNASEAEITFIRNASAVITNYLFFARGEAGASLLTTSISVTHDHIHLAIALRKNQVRVNHTLRYSRFSRFNSSPIDLLIRYDSLRRQMDTSSRYYWALKGHRHNPSAGTMSQWLKSCLQHCSLTPPPQVSWTSHSLRSGAGSECAAIGVPEYRILQWGDWGSARTFRESYFDGRVQATTDSYFFFGHLLPEASIATLRFGSS